MHTYGIRDGVLCSDNATARAKALRLTGRESVQLGDYDRIVLTGLRFSIFETTALFQSQGPIDLPSFQRKLQIKSHVTLVSKAQVMAQSWEQMDNTPMMRLARSLREVLDQPILIASQPRPTQQVLVKGSRFGSFFNVHQRGDQAYVSEFCDTQADAYCRKLGVTYLAQPKGTIADHIFTDDSYMIGMVHTAEKKRKLSQVDYRHANVKFGKLMLDKITSAKM